MGCGTGRRRRCAKAAALALAAALSACSVVGAPSPTPPPAQPRPGDALPPPRPDDRTGAAARRAGDPVPRRYQEVRALWVVRTTLVSPESIRAMVERADGAGFNTLIVQVRGRGDAYYAGGIEPRADALAGQPASFDPLALVLEEAHARGMAVHAWLNTHLVADGTLVPSDPRHIVHARPDLLAVPRSLAPTLHDMSPYDRRYVEALRRHATENTSTVEGLFTNPAHPDVQALVRDIWLDVATRYDVDGLHFDYVRYAGPTYDYSRASLEAFRRWAIPRLSAADGGGPAGAPRRRTADGVRADAASLDAAARDDPLAWPAALPGLWDRFRREQITGLVERVYRDVKAVRPDLVVSAAVFADPVDAFGARYQDWRGWLDAGIVDVVAPMAYSPDDARFRRQIDAAVEAAGDPRRVWAGIGAYLTGFDGTVRKIGIAREEGAGGVVLFSYDWIVAEGEGPGGRTFLEGVGERAFFAR